MNPKFVSNKLRALQYFFICVQGVEFTLRLSTGALLIQYGSATQILAAAATVAPRSRTMDFGAAKGCFSGWGGVVGPGAANSYATILLALLEMIVLHRSGRLVHSGPGLGSFLGEEDAREAVGARQGRIRVVAPDPPTAQYRESRKPSAQSRSAPGCKIPPALRPAIAAGVGRWRR